MKTGCEVATMTNAATGISYHHLSSSRDSPESYNATTEAGLFATLNRLAALGFDVDTDGARLKVAPAALLSTEQRNWLKAHKPALIAAVSTPRWRWCVEYPDGTRYVAHFAPEADWRCAAADWRGAAVWPAPENIDVLGWIMERHQNAISGDSGDSQRQQ
jgi:hypothetical protein